MTMRPSERSKIEMAKRGYLTGMAEQWVLLRAGQATHTAQQQQRKTAGGFRKDLHGFIDLHCLRSDIQGVTAVQATTKQQMSKHLRDYRRTPVVREAIRTFLDGGNTLLLHGWEKTTVPNKSGDGSHVRWVLHEYPITEADLELNDADRRAMGELPVELNIRLTPPPTPEYRVKVTYRFISDSRWGSSRWHTFWVAQDAETHNRDTALFEISGVATFTAAELRADMRYCLADVVTLSLPSPVSLAETEELRRYMVEFLADVDEAYPLPTT